MSTLRTLWRVEGVDEAMDLDHERLADGVRLHLHHADLHVVVMQIGDRQQLYIGLDGCGGCAHGRCEVGCYVELFRRLLLTIHPTLRLAHVRDGLASRPYTRMALALPRHQARLLDGSLLNPWSEARLIMHWRGEQPRSRVAALLLVGADGPDPAVALRTWGWRVASVPGRVLQRWVCRPQPPTLFWQWRWPGAPNLALPATAASADKEVRADDRTGSPSLEMAHPDESTQRNGERARNGHGASPGPTSATHQSDANGNPSSTSQNGTNADTHTSTQNGTNGDAGANRHVQTPQLPSLPPIPNGNLIERAAIREGVDTAELDDAALTAWLRSAIARARQPQPPPAPASTMAAQPAAAAKEETVGEAVPIEAEDVDAASPWPLGPGDLRPTALAELIARLTTDPAFTTAPQASQIGVVKGRLIKLLGLSDEVAAALMVWLDASGVLAEPYRPEDRWRKPRPLAVTDLDQIAERLRVTALPDAAAIQAAYAPQD